METSIILKFSFDRQEFIRAARLFAFETKTLSRSSVVTIPLVIVFAVIYGAVWDFDALCVGVLVVGAAAAVLGLGVYFFLPAKNYEQFSKLHPEFRITFREENIAFGAGETEIEIEWEKFTGVVKSREFYCLLGQNRSYTILPARALPDKKTADTLEHLFGQMIGDIKVLNK